MNLHPLHQGLPCHCKPLEGQSCPAEGFLSIRGGFPLPKALSPSLPGIVSLNLLPFQLHILCHPSVSRHTRLYSVSAFVQSACDILARHASIVWIEFSLAFRTQVKHHLVKKVFSRLPRLRWVACLGTHIPSAYLPWLT